MELEQISFRTRDDLRKWLVTNHSSSRGVMVRIFKKSSSKPSVTFYDLLEEGLCFGWSESQRLPFDDKSYLQKFTPRRTRGTASQRNRRLVGELEQKGLMTDAGRQAL